MFIRSSFDEHIWNVLFFLSIHFTDMLQSNVNSCMQDSVYRMGCIWTFDLFILLKLSYKGELDLDAGSMCDALLAFTQTDYGKRRDSINKNDYFLEYCY